MSREADPEPDQDQDVPVLRAPVEPPVAGPARRRRGAPARIVAEGESLPSVA
jgi:hypothetical protein